MSNVNVFVDESRKVAKSIYRLLKIQYSNISKISPCKPQEIVSSMCCCRSKAL